MFKIGDEVEIINDFNYAITTQGSRGIVLEVISSRLVSVQFTKITSRIPARGDTFSIFVEHLMLLPHCSIEELVLRKIQTMYARQYRKTGYACFL